MPELDLLRKIAALEARLNRLESAELSPELAAPYLALPNLRGFWPMSSQDNSGNAYDLSGQGRTLTNNGTATFDVYNNVVPFVDLNGSSQYMSRADESALDISSALTLGVWFRPDVVTGSQGLVSKYTVSGSQQSYLLYLNAATLYADISSTGANDFTVTIAGTTASVWHFGALRFTPSTELAVWLDGTKAVNTTSIPASLFNSTAALQLGLFNTSGTYLNGGLALAFVCAAALTDQLIGSLFQRTRARFGV